MPIKPTTHKPARTTAKRHEVIADHHSKTRKDFTNASGYGYKWRLASRAWLKENPLCMDCQDKGRVRLASEVHHSEAHRGDMALFWDKSKWRGLCRVCHSVHTARGG